MQQFAIDKSVNVFIEYLAEEFIKAYWERRGKRIQVYENPAGDLKGKQKFDRTDSLGNKWEVKNQVGAWWSGNFYLEDQAFDHSDADFHLHFVHGLAVVFTREQLAEIRARSYQNRRGGDGDRSTGLIPPVSEILAFGEVITLSRYI